MNPHLTLLLFGSILNQFIQNSFYHLLTVYYS